jgi:hypothetical protein
LGLDSAWSKVALFHEPTRRCFFSPTPLPIPPGGVLVLCAHAGLDGRNQILTETLGPVLFLATLATTKQASFAGRLRRWVTPFFESSKHQVLAVGPYRGERDWLAHLKSGQAVSAMLDIAVPPPYGRRLPFKGRTARVPLLPLRAALQSKVPVYFFGIQRGPWGKVHTFVQPLRDFQNPEQGFQCYLEALDAFLEGQWQKWHLARSFQRWVEVVDEQSPPMRDSSLDG